MAIKHSHRHRTRWKIIELRSANAKKHFALFFVVVVAAQSSPSLGTGALQSTSVWATTKHCFIPHKPPGNNFTPWWLFRTRIQQQQQRQQKLWQRVPVWPFILCPPLYPLPSYRSNSLHRQHTQSMSGAHTHFRLELKRNSMFHAHCSCECVRGCLCDCVCLGVHVCVCVWWLLLASFRFY